MFIFGVLASFLIPFGYLIDRAAIPDMPYDTLIVRCVGAVVAVPALFYSRTPTSWRSGWELYLYWLFIPMLAFVWGVMMVGNAAAADPANGSADLLFWVLQYVVALFMATQLSSSPYVATGTYLIGTLASFVWVYLTVDTINWDEIYRIHGWPTGAYLTAVWVASYTNRNTSIVRSESLAAARSVGTNVAHEMRTPLAGISSRARAAKRLLPDLVDAYHRAQAADLTVKPITSRQLELLSTTLEDIEKEAQHSNLMIDILLANTSENPVFGQSLATQPASVMVDNALGRYPFANDHERNLVHQDTHEDFDATVPAILLDHVVFNLIKNALYHVQNHGSGSITVSIQRSSLFDSAGTISVYDDGPGIPASSLERIFDRFYTTTRAGTGSGVGLNFCKMVMEGIGGSIAVKSVEGKYTEFTLVFPRKVSNTALT